MNKNYETQRKHAYGLTDQKRECVSKVMGYNSNAQQQNNSRG